MVKGRRIGVEASRPSSTTLASTASCQLLVELSSVLSFSWDLLHHFDTIGIGSQNLLPNSSGSANFRLFCIGLNLSTLLSIHLQMSSCLSGGGRAYGFELEIVKSSSTSSRTSQSSSPSSTISESSNSPLALSTRKPRTPRKRPNQTYNEAAALLSTAYPNIFSSKHLTKPCKFSKPRNSFLNESSELLLPFRVIDDSGFLLHQPIQEKTNFRLEPKCVSPSEKPCQSPVENDFHSNSSDLCDGYQEDFDCGINT
ncbi:hypothetical protein F0562_009121 [Nyssa sinensis]|uniref:Uncharacterized protein n=1 Tax=Nyssa sinensis TaxID=561372 RepID=A0A5J5A033_9ASTE|nr:hypothetical protein F0562_009121 [Nyssa sinensis]